MRSVRCDACGTKALMAASKCPKCGHGFEVRDGFGELLPLSHCATCDSYYPAKLGACKWCGTQPEKAPIGPYVWKGVGVLTFVAMAWGAWLVHDDPPADVSAARMKAMLKPDSSVQADPITTSAGTLASVAPADTVTRDTAVTQDTTVVVDAPLPIDSATQPPATLVATADTATPIEPAPPPPAPAPAPLPKRVVARAPERTLPRAPARAANRSASKPAPKVATAKTAPKASAKSKTRGVWVNSVARNWVVVRAGASRSARVIASIGPNTRVQLGESKGGWRRIRAKGLAGWVEHRSFFARAGAPRNAGRLAAR